MWMSIQGMYEYDPSLFDGLDIPSYEDAAHTVHVIDKNAVINSICLKCAELELLYTAIDTMKLAIGVWSAANQETWYKMIETQYIKFNPIWNVDADVTVTRNHSGGNDSTRSVQGFNSSSWANADKDNNLFSETESVTERRTGNIGVTASQDLIQKQRDIADFNIIDFITESFKKRFCLMVY